MAALGCLGSDFQSASQFTLGMKNFIIALLMVLSICPTASQAALSPVSINIVPPVQFPPADFDVTGLRLSAFWGSHREVYGFDFGVIGNRSRQKFSGLAVSGLFNYTGGQTRIFGLQLAGGTNFNDEKTTVIGLQAAALLNYNSAESSVHGVQLSLVNYSPFTKVVGVQVGLYNKAKTVYGLQIGLLNFTDNLCGLQIGLLNFNSTGLFAVSPFINFGF